MPIVTRSDCTEIAVKREKVDFTYNTVTGLSAKFTDLSIQFNACRGANNNNNDLSAYVERLANEKRISEETKDAVDTIIVGETYCREAIDSFLEEKGLTATAKCRYSSPANCGCKEVQQTDYRGTVAVTESGRTCQRWDARGPHKPRETREEYPDANLIENYCRNPGGRSSGAWYVAMGVCVKNTFTIISIHRAFSHWSIST
jgi:hypothetical protein